jgi:hypothetical protein
MIRKYHPDGTSEVMQATAGDDRPQETRRPDNDHTQETRRPDDVAPPLHDPNFLDWWFTWIASTEKPNNDFL